MSLFRFVGVLSRFAICAAFLPGAAQAADNTRYVSTTGSNASTCTLAAPCRTLQAGINKTPEGGELRILDSGFYGNNATIEKSLTVTGNGNTVYLGNSLTINKTGAVVNVRGLTLDGQNTVVDGIRVVTAAAVNIERCTIHGFTQDGIQAAFGPIDLFIKDSTLRRNKKNGLLMAAGPNSSLHVDNSHFDYNGSFGGTGGGAGMSITVPIATISRSTVSGNNGGLSAGNGTRVSIVSTVASGNFVGGGFNAGNGSTMVLESSIANGNNHGLSVSNGGLVQISNSNFAGNLCCAIVNQGTVETRRNNTIKGSIAGNALVPFGAQ